MSLTELLKDSLIVMDMAADDKISAIKELGLLMEKEGRITDFAMYIDAVLKREEEATTGIGFGVAIPHGKSAAVTEPTLAFGRSEKGITYDSMDGKPVHLIFLIAVPENSNDEHLRILSQLSRKLMHQDVRDNLINADSKSKIYEVVGT